MIDVLSESRQRSLWFEDDQSAGSRSACEIEPGVGCRWALCPSPIYKLPGQGGKNLFLFLNKEQ